MTNRKNQTRRQFLATSATATAGLLLGTQQLAAAPAILKYYNKPNSNINGVQIGVITYSFRSMPDQSAEATLKYILESGINAIELMGDPAENFAGKPTTSFDRRKFFGLLRKQRNSSISEQEKVELRGMQAEQTEYRKKLAQWRATVPMDKFKQLRKMYKQAGVKIYGFKPGAFGKNNTDAEIDYGIRAAKALGASHITLEHPSDDAHTLKLGTMARKHKIRVAYHGHTQQTPTFWDTALGQSKFNAMNPDVGHYVAAGYDDTLDLLSKYHKNIYSIHLKDRQSKANGQTNMPWGSGDTPIPEILQLMRREKYKFPGTVELEYEIPDGSDAVKEVQNCLEFCRKALA